MNFSEVIIIGAGPAGLSAAIQLKRYEMDVIVFEKDEVGGLLRNANLVENYPGFPKGINGTRLVRLFKEQFQNNDLEIIKKKVLKIKRDEHQFIVETKHDKYFTNNLIIASGTKPKIFNSFEISENSKPFIYYDTHSLLKEKNKTIVIVGAGDAAFDYSLNLGKNNEIILLNRSEEIKSLPLLWERIKINKSINYFSNSEINGIKWTGSILEINVVESGKSKIIFADYLVFAIGREPELSFLQKNNIEELEKFIKQEALYVIGDVKNGLYRQTSISVGEGIKAAMKIYTKKQETLK